MQSGYRTFSCAAALVLFAAISRGSAQVTCFTTPSSAGELNCGSDDGAFTAASIEACCLGPTGQFFEDPGSESCTPCIVFGWLDGTDITLDERNNTYELQAGFVKGGAVQTSVDSQRMATFDIQIEGRGAGVNEDFVVPNSTHSLSGPPFSVPVTVRLDGIALEPDEEFVLSLRPTNLAAMQIITEGTFVLNALHEIIVTIRDLETVSLQFTEIEYSNMELGRFIRPQLQLNTTIATDLIVEVIPLNLTYARERMLLPESLDPELMYLNFDPSTQTATSGADFSIMPVQVTFASGSSPETIGFDMEIIDDTIHEANQVFVLSLEVISDIDRNRLVPTRIDGLTSLGRIIDDDPLCPDPVDPVNGMVTFGISVNDTATYSCNMGFELIGSATATCTQVDVNSAAFSQAPPVCRPLCPDPVDPVNGMVTFTGNSVDDTAAYSCNMGFELIGSATVTCTQVDVNSAAFSQAPPVCRPLCPDPVDPVNGMMTFTGNSVDDTAAYSCNMGFELVGSTTVTCEQVNVNSAAFSPIMCRLVDCGIPPSIDNGNFNVAETTFEAVAEYGCNEGFTLSGNQSRTCQADRTWSGAVPVCVVPQSPNGDNLGPIIGGVIAGLLVIFLVTLAIILATVFARRQRMAAANIGLELQPKASNQANDKAVLTNFHHTTNPLSHEEVAEQNDSVDS